VKGCDATLPKSFFAVKRPQMIRFASTKYQKSGFYLYTWWAQAVPSEK